MLDAASDGADRRARSDLAVGDDLSGTYVTLDRISDTRSRPNWLRVSRALFRLMAGVRDGRYLDRTGTHRQ